MDKYLNVVDYDSKDTIFRGYIDKVIAHNDTLILIDYKTGKVKPDMRWDQLLYYGIALFSLMPFDKILLMNVFVETGDYNKQVLYRKDIKKYQKALLINIKNIEQTQKFKKNETNLCDWCDYRSRCGEENV
jgi:RecB family exonuclease